MSPESTRQFQLSPENAEMLAAREQTIRALNEKGMKDLEARELLSRYADLCHAEADREAALAPEDPDASNRANTKAEIKIALLWREVTAEGAMETAWDLLVQIQEGASQNSATFDLAEEIGGHLERINSQQP